MTTDAYLGCLLPGNDLVRSVLEDKVLQLLLQTVRLLGSPRLPVEQPRLCTAVDPSPLDLSLLLLDEPITPLPCRIRTSLTPGATTEALVLFLDHMVE